MSINILYKDFPKICRLCLTYGELQPLIELKGLNTFRNVMDLKLLTEEDDKLPSNVCLTCVQQLEDLKKFIEMCLKNEKILKVIVLQEIEQEYEDIYDRDDVKSENSVDQDFFYKNVKQEIVKLEPDVVLQLNNNKQTTCENCSEVFSNSTELSDHYKNFEKCKPKELETKNDVCNIVDYLKKPRGKKTKKVKIKEESDGEAEYIKGKKLKGKRRFLCNYCGKNYTRKNGLERHMLSHSGIKPFECRECGKCYITKDTLKTHLLTHTGIKAHKCTLCQKSFTQSSHLSYHMRRHNGEKPHTCTFCGKAFLSSYHLERHKLMHTGVKPYECNLCGKQFVRSTTLRDHMLIHTGEKPFQCQHCGKQFNRKQSLTNHVLVHTGGKDNNTNKSVPLAIITGDTNLRCGEFTNNHVLNTDNIQFVHNNTSLEAKNNSSLVNDVPSYLQVKETIPLPSIFVNNSLDTKISNGESDNRI